MCLFPNYRFTLNYLHIHLKTLATTAQSTARRRLRSKTITKVEELSGPPTIRTKVIMMRRILFSLLVLSALGPVAAHGQSNTAYIDQIGNHNEVAVSQNGFGHWIKAYQDGIRNEIIVKQSGDRIGRRSLSRVSRIS
jgi:Curlin associated repeat